MNPFCSVALAQAHQRSQLSFRELCTETCDDVSNVHGSVVTCMKLFSHTVVLCIADTIQCTKTKQ
jgi:hypothetical protein